MKNRYWRSGGLAVAAGALTLVLAACGGPGSPSVAKLGTNSSGNGSRNSATPVQKNDAGGLVVEWAACMRRHGDHEQSVPTIDVHGVINIYIPETGSLANEVHNGTAPCNEYLAAASAALKAASPVAKPPDQTQLVEYSQCMRTHGVPSYPDPGTGGTTDFNGTGVDPNSPLFERANDLCGRLLHLPGWWVSGDGPPGDVSVQSGPPGGIPPAAKKGVVPKGAVPGAARGG